MQTYTITEDPPGTFRVRQGRHLLPEEFRSEEAALKRVDVLSARGDKVVKEDADGYRVPVRRKRWRQ